MLTMLVRKLYGRAGHTLRDKEEPLIGPQPACAAERKAQAAQEARERSDRILEEERAKDRAWRQAVLMVCLPSLSCSLS